MLMEIIRKNKQFFSYCGVYALCCINDGKQLMYIGSSKNVFFRLKTHIRSLHYGDHFNRHLQGLWNKLGEDAFILIKLECTSELERVEVERSYIECNANVNLSSASKVSVGNKRNKGKTYLEIFGTKFPPCGFKLGNKPSEETRLLFSEQAKEMWRSGKLKGRTKSPETIKKMSEARKKYWELRHANS